MTASVSIPAYPYESGPRPYGLTAGLRLLRALETAGQDVLSAADAVAAGQALGLSSGHAIALLHRLAAAGWLARARRGLYAIVDPATGQPRAHPFAIGAALARPAAISHWSALQHWGLTTQLPAVVTLSTPKRATPPRVAIAGARYEIVTIAARRWFGVTQAWVDERHAVAIFEPERALLDAFHHFHIFGSLSTALELLEERHDALDLERLVAYAARLEIGAVAKRLGWALERLGAGETLLAPLRACPGRGDIPLDPRRPARGRHNSAWGVIENLGDGG
jgi:predicted transcriptional regulator of viral defense system